MPRQNMLDDGQTQARSARLAAAHHVDPIEALRQTRQMLGGNARAVVAHRQADLLPLTAGDDRERHILTERRLKESPTTLEDLSQHYGISRERVRQIEVRAFEKLQKAIRNAAIEERLAS